MQANSLTPFPVVLLVGWFVCLFVLFLFFVFVLLVFCFLFLLVFFMGGKKEIGNMCCEHSSSNCLSKNPCVNFSIIVCVFLS